jgi:hypothetical protein
MLEEGFGVKGIENLAKFFDVREDERSSTICVTRLVNASAMFVEPSIDIVRDADVE